MYPNWYITFEIDLRKPMPTNFTKQPTKSYLNLNKVCIKYPYFACATTFLTFKNFE